MKFLESKKGGFLYKKYDNRYVKTLATIDFIFDIISLIPENMLTQNYNNIYSHMALHHC